MSENPKRRKRGNPNFYKGMPSVNPNGRKKGSVNKYTALAREVMSAKGPEIVQKVIDKAMDGDNFCLKMCIDRILPVQKAVDPNRAKQDSQIVINVASIDSIEQKVKDFDEAEVIEPEQKNDDEVIVNISNE
jgi:hypothetical protein